MILTPFNDMLSALIALEVQAREERKRQKEKAPDIILVEVIIRKRSHWFTFQDVLTGLKYRMIVNWPKKGVNPFLNATLDEFGKKSMSEIASILKESGLQYSVSVWEAEW